REPGGTLRKIRWRLDWINRRRGIVVIEKRPLEPEMLIGKVPAPLAVVGNKYTQVLIGQKQQQRIEWVRFTTMPERALAVVAEVEKAISRAREARIGSVQG